MNIIDALRWSKENGRSISREDGVGWIRYGDDFVFKLTGIDLLATDWIPTAALVEELTEGKYEHVETYDVDS